MILRDRVSGRRLLSGTVSVRTYARGRVCRAGDCGTVLSAYNPSSFCALHERALPRPRRARRQAAERACENFPHRRRARQPAAVASSMEPQQAPSAQASPAPSFGPASSIGTTVSRTPR